MGQPAAKRGDLIVAVDYHIVIQPAPAPPLLLAHPFHGALDGELSPNVNIMGGAAATVGSTATNVPHVPTPPGIAFQRPPANRGMVQLGSGTVRINGKPAARAGDIALTCNDPIDLPLGRVVVAGGSVMIGS